MSTNERYQAERAMRGALAEAGLRGDILDAASRDVVEKIVCAVLAELRERASRGAPEAVFVRGETDARTPSTAPETEVGDG